MVRYANYLISVIIEELKVIFCVSLRYGMLGKLDLICMKTEFKRHFIPQ